MDLFLWGVGGLSLTPTKAGLYSNALINKVQDNLSKHVLCYGDTTLAQNWMLEYFSFSLHRCKIECGSGELHMERGKQDVTIRLSNDPK